MSTTRKSGGAYEQDRIARQANGGTYPRGPNGKRICRNCPKEVPPGRRTHFCSKECVHEFKVRCDPGYVRQCLLERDHGICAKCGTNALEGCPPVHLKYQRGSGHRWQADHIIPVIEGGGECTLDNYRTLCTKCHNEETAALRKRLAEKRRASA